MACSRLSFLLLLSVAFVPAGAQNAPPSPTALTQASGALQPALMDVTHAITSLNVSHWKASGQVRSASEADANSIQSDLQGTLPGLISQSNAAPSSVAASFAVYRNVDALYDVLLRLAQTAVLAAPKVQAGNLQYALSRLESVRKGMGDAIFMSAQNNDAELVKLQTAVKAAAIAGQKSATTTVVNDGPVAAHHTTHRRKKRPAKPAPPQQ